MTQHNEMGPSKGTNILLWALQVIGAVSFSLYGSSKLAGSEQMVQLFAAVGYGQWLRYVTGSLEIAGAFLLIFPGTAFFGACLLGGVMIGATIANLALLGISSAVPLSLLILMTIIAVGRHPRKHSHHVPAHAHPLH